MKLVIFDSGLIMKTGHHYSLNKGLINECKKRGIETELYAMRQVRPEIAEELGAKPYFTDWLYIRASEHPMSGYIEDFIKINDSYLADLKRLPEGTVGADDVLLLHTVQYNVLYGFAQWLKTVKPDNCPKVHVVFGMPGYFDHQTQTFNVFASLYHYALKTLLETPAFMAGLVTFSSGTEQMARHFEVMMEKKVHVRKINGPCMFDAEGLGLDNLFAKARKAGSSERITVGFFGHATGVKGLHLIPPIVPTVLDKFPNVDFIIHANPFDKVSQFAKEIEAKYPNRVRFEKGELDSVRYFNVMMQSDLNVLPYHPLYYRDSMSGVFIESMCLSRPIVVPSGSWMEQEAKANGGGVETFDGWDSGGLEVAVSRALSNYQTLVQQAAVTGEAFRKKKTFASFLDTALGIEGAQQGQPKFSVSYAVG